MFDYKSFSKKAIQYAKKITSEYFADEYTQKSFVKYVEKYSLIAGEKITNCRYFKYLDDNKQKEICIIILQNIFMEFIELNNEGICFLDYNTVFRRITDKIIDMYKKTIFLCEPNDKKYLNKIDTYVKKIHSEFLKKYHNIGKYNTLHFLCKNNEFDILTIKFGEDILKIIDDFEILILPKNVNLRNNIADKLGYSFPIVHMFEEYKLKDNEYQILVREKLVFQGTYISEDEKSIDEIFSNLEKVIIENIHTIFSVKDTYQYLEYVEEEYSKKVVKNLLKELDINDIKTVFCNLIQKEISIRDLPYVVENLANFARFDKDTDILTEKMANLLSKQNFS